MSTFITEDCLPIDLFSQISVEMYTHNLLSHPYLPNTQCNI